MKIIERIYNLETNETTDIERDMTDQEIAKVAENLKVAELEAKAAQTKATARQAVLDKLGLTTEEIAALLS